MSCIDEAFELARAGRPPHFAAWMALVERPLRSSLRRFARAVDVEVVLQETLLRMWIAARETGRVFEGENASLRFALRVARNVALEEVRRCGHGRLVALDDLAGDIEPAVPPVPIEDHGLFHAIRECIERLGGKPRRALLERLVNGHESSDRDLARTLSMTTNTFLQNIVRARRAVAKCLAGKGVPLQAVPR